MSMTGSFFQTVLLSTWRPGELEPTEQTIAIESWGFETRGPC